jgi:hypothetical protein
LPWAQIAWQPVLKVLTNQHLQRQYGQEVIGIMLHCSIICPKTLQTFICSKILLHSMRIICIKSVQNYFLQAKFRCDQRVFRGKFSGQVPPGRTLRNWGCHMWVVYLTKLKIEIILNNLIFSKYRWKSWSVYWLQFSFCGGAHFLFHCPLFLGPKTGQINTTFILK